MRLRHIEIFEAIRRTGSLTEAAAALHISQPAASKLLAHAESQLGFKLFDRVKGRLVATREAEILTPEIARLSQDLSSVRRLASNLRDRPNGHLRLGCAPALGLGLLPGVVRDSRDAQPGITFDIHTHHSAELVQGLLTRELDLAITFDTNDYPGLTRMGLGHTELVHLSRRAAQGPLRLSELSEARGVEASGAGASGAAASGAGASGSPTAADTLIVLDASDASGALLQLALDAQGLAPQVAIQVQTHYVACALVDAGCGDAIVDAITAQAMLRPGMTLRRLEPALRVPISIMTRNQDPLSALHRDLIERLRAACAALLEGLDARV
ncbi:LysR family transcriptional regulator [Achromobacter sp. 77]|uniref:LysR family transcriptional regulator n=1 Tax=Achromobacter TaxID=222 RepID=UPI001D00716C|nr:MULTISPECIES: LysR substrate-binding domain-containing protein [Achromobacter]MCU6618966.1 LysR substrate-binding domain-containing protein [Achromobacter mucicolens]UDG76545.1 LysR family transcriptional regulator [Achromobacter sp. 77]